MKRNLTFLVLSIIFYALIDYIPVLNAQVSEQDSLALVALYDSTDGDNWINKGGWFTDYVGGWYGVTVIEGRVIVVNLSGNKLVGKIPPELGNLTDLIELNLKENQLTDSIPSELGNMTSLEILNLSNNHLTGTIPPALGNLDSLMCLYLHMNDLSGPIPPELGNLDSLIHLYLFENLLSGSIPPEFGDLLNLTHLRLYDNQLSGSIPVELGNLTNLTYLHLGNNQLTDSIPPELGDLTSLTELYLNNNYFTGLPDLSLMPSLTYLNTANNRFTFEDIEPNIAIENFIYSPQDSIGMKQDTTLSEGQSLTLLINIGGTANQYQWYKNDIEIAGKDSSALVIESLTLADSGSYRCNITSSIVTELTLYSRPVAVHAGPATGIADRLNYIPTEFRLIQNYPNPFNPVTKISYSLPKMGFVTLKIFDVLGREVKTLVNKYQAAGNYSINFNANDLSSGIYFYKLKVEDNFVKTKKMLLLR